MGDLGAHRATAADADRVTEIITLAFAQDPLWGHALARPGGGEATTIWIPPGGADMTPEQEHRLVALAAEHLGPAADDYVELLGRFEAAHPHAEPHYFLTLFGTHPDHRGRGIGMRLLAHDLELIDAEHMPAYLESSNPANNRRYASVGFEPHGEFSYPGGGPVVTTMWRPAR